MAANKLHDVQEILDQLELFYLSNTITIKAAAKLQA
jgi:hypothetical protein